MEMSIEGIDRHSIAEAFNTHDPKSVTGMLKKSHIYRKKHLFKTQTAVILYVYYCVGLPFLLPLFALYFKSNTFFGFDQ